MHLYVKLRNVDCLRIATSLGSLSPLFDCIIASSAAHLSQAGHLSQEVVLQRKSRALLSLRKAISVCQLTANSRTDYDRHSYIQSCETNLYASVLLVGLAVAEGTSFDETLTLIFGSAQLAKQCFKLNLQSASDSTRSTIRCLAYFDVLTSVPYPRPPAIRLDDNCLAEYDSYEPNFLSLDPFMGCLRSIFAVITKASELLHRYFTYAIRQDDFLSQRDSLLFYLAHWTSPSPTMFRNTTGYDWEQSHFAELAFTCATQIYLLRSINNDLDSERILALTRTLRDSIVSIPITSSLIAMMLWPAFVWGCESYEEVERTNVTKWFESVAAKQSFGNILVTLEALRKIWNLQDHDFSKDDLITFTSDIAHDHSSQFSRGCGYQSSWVKLCWEHKICLNLA